MEDRKKILDKAKKLKELADRGVGGEQTNAKDFLSKYMLKHSLTIDEITAHDMSDEYKNMPAEQFVNLMLFEFAIFGIEFLSNILMGVKNPIPEFKKDGLLVELLTRVNKK